MKKTMSIIACVFLATGISSGQTFKRVMMSMPRQIDPLVTQSNISDALIYMEEGMECKLLNRFHKYATFEGDPTKSMTIRSSETSETTVTLLPCQDGDTLVCVVSTVKIGKASDSQVDVYSNRWEKLDAGKYVTVPSLRDFMKEDMTDEGLREEVVRQLDIPLVAVSVLTDPLGLSFRLASLDWVDHKTRERVMSGVNTQIRMRWDGERFVKGE